MTHERVQAVGWARRMRRLVVANFLPEGGTPKARAWWTALEEMAREAGMPSELFDGGVSTPVAVSSLVDHGVPLERIYAVAMLIFGEAPPLNSEEVTVALRRHEYGHLQGWRA